MSTCFFYLLKEGEKMNEIDTLEIPKIVERGEVAEEIVKISDYWGVAQAAKFLGVDKTTVKRWAKEGKIPHYRHPLTKFHLFKKEDLLDFMKKFTVHGKEVK